MTGKIIATSTGNVSGTMANNGSVNGTVGLSVAEFTIAKGYHDGTGKVTLDSDIETALAAI